MKELIQLLNGQKKVIKLMDGRELSLITSRDTQDDSKMGFYLKTPISNGKFSIEKISNMAGYTLVSQL